uniref:Uncharacterized protein n=1 Tax=Oryza rufipogon TaxID=4529 RepID=A0A0E0PFD4_ORYRU
MLGLSILRLSTYLLYLFMFAGRKSRKSWKLLPLYILGWCSSTSSSAQWTSSSIERPWMLAIEILDSFGLRTARWTRDLSWPLLNTSRWSPTWTWRAPGIAGTDVQASSSWCITSSPGELCNRMVRKP